MAKCIKLAISKAQGQDFSCWLCVTAPRYVRELKTWLNTPDFFQMMLSQGLGYWLYKCQGCPDGSDSKESVYISGTQVLSLGWEDLLEKAMVTHCSILAWRISWTEEPNGLQNMGLPRVRRNWHFQFSLLYKCLPGCTFSIRKSNKTLLHVKWIINKDLL